MNPDERAREAEADREDMRRVVPALLARIAELEEQRDDLEIRLLRAQGEIDRADGWAVRWRRAARSWRRTARLGAADREAAARFAALLVCERARLGVAERWGLAWKRVAKALRLRGAGHL